MSTGNSRGDRAQPTSNGASRSPCQAVSLEVPGVELLVEWRGLLRDNRGLMNSLDSPGRQLYLQWSSCR